MAEYIEREALKQKIAEVQDESGDPISGSQYEIGYHNGLTMAYTLAITATAADVAPVSEVKLHHVVISENGVPEIKIQLGEKALVLHTDPVDVAPVVRCKDCKHRKLSGVSPYLYYCCADNDGLVGAVRDDDFCSYGERKDGEGK